MEFLREPEVWVGVGFLLVLGLFVYKGVPKLIGRALDARAAAISKELDEAKRLREEAEALLAQYREKAANADTEAEPYSAKRAPRPSASKRSRASR